MPRQLTAEQAIEHIKKNGPTKFRLTDGGSIACLSVYEGLGGSFFKTVDDKFFSTHYKGKFELVPTEDTKRQPFPEYAMTPGGVKIISDITVDDGWRGTNEYPVKQCTIATEEEYEAQQGISIEEAEKRLGLKIKR